MREETRFLVVSGHIVGMQRGVRTTTDARIALVKGVLRPWMEQEPNVHAIDTSGDDITDEIRLGIAETIKALPRTCRALVVLLCKWRFETTVNYLNTPGLGHENLTVILACSNTPLIADLKTLRSFDTSRVILERCTRFAPILPPGLYCIRSMEAELLMRVKSGQVVKFDVGSDRFYIEK